MPYKVVGQNLMHEKDGKWSVKQHCTSHENAVKAMQLLQGLEHGTIKREDVGKKPTAQGTKRRVLYRA
jgi:hypothetical protein